MRRVLLVMIQPPGCSGVQALIYNKLLPFFEDQGWEFHFAGPAPGLVSVLTEELNYPPERLHYTTNISLSRQCAVRKNRHAKGSLSYMVFGGLQLLTKVLEKLIGHQSDAYFLRGLEATVREAERQWNFDVIGGKSPDFKVLTLVSRLTREIGKPFFAMVVDPYGARMETGFYPNEPELQRQILDQCCAALFMSPLTRDRYIEAELVSPEKAHYFTESYPEIPDLYQAHRSALTAGPRPLKDHQPLQLIYLGMLPEWRPIEPFLDALSRLEENPDRRGRGFALSIFGFVYPAARQRIDADPHLAKIIKIYPMVAYGESHWLAEDADLQFVVIGPRHLDNYPSKFFEYLAHHKPVLVLGPPQNPLKQIVEELGIGLYVDGRDAEAILEALTLIQSNYQQFQQAYHTHAAAIETYSAHRVAEHFCSVLDAGMAWEERARAL